MKFSRGDFFKTLHLFRVAFGRYRWPLLGLTGVSFISSILEGVGINAVIPLFSFVNQSPERGTDTISRAIATLFGFLHIPYLLRYLILFIIALFLLKVLLIFVVNYSANAISTHYEQRVRTRIFTLTLEADWPYLADHRIGYLDQLLTTDILNSSALLNRISSSTILFTSLIMYVLVAINISMVIALLALVVALVVFLVFKPLFYRAKVVSAAMGSMYKELTHFVSESLIGIKTVKSLAVEEPVARHSAVFFSRLRKLRMRSTSLSASTNALLQPIGLLFVMAIFSYFYKTGGFNLASFAVIVYAIHKVFDYLQLGQAQLHLISALIPYVESVERYQVVAASNQETAGGNRSFHFTDRLEFRHVQFTYATNQAVLADVMLSIPRGLAIGLIGPSGAGKTTLVDLMLRLLEPTSGTVTIDGVDIREINLHEWRTHLGYVPQDAFLLNDTIENNIKFYDPRISATKMTVAARMANIYDFIMAQPGGFATVVGERGVKLSGGQRQRIALARLLARRSEILILDEATSALDSESEAAVRQAVANLRGTVTVIIIAHRLSTIMSVDRLLVLDRGTITEEGRPLDLLKDPQSYFSRVAKLAEQRNLIT